MTRRPAILLGLILLAAPGCEALHDIGADLTQTSREIGNLLGGKTPIRSAQKMQDPYSPDNRREGINELVEYDWGKKPPYTTYYQQMAQNDPDYLVRATAVRALNRARDRSATPIFIKGLSDSSERVRLESAKALANVPDPAAEPILVKIVANADENRDLRIASADALKHYRKPEVARSLINVLNGRDYGVAWQSRHSLKTLTGQDLRYNEAAWIALMEKEKPFG